jgi:uncharacterized protein
MSQQFIDHIKQGYSPTGSSIVLGAGMIGEEVFPEAKVMIALSMLSRHGLISGATGTGKTKTLQRFTEQLSDNGIPSLVMDIKGDISGLAAAGSTNQRIEERQAKINTPWQGQKYPVEFVSISDEPGTRMRATISEFGPNLLSKILQLNDTQSSVLSMIFKYCDDRKLALLDIKDLRKVLQYLSNEGKEEIEGEYGQISPSTVNTIMRSLVELESQGATKFFGEVSFDIADMMRTNSEGKGFINILRLTDMNDKPQLFSTFMLCLLAELYEKLPEAGEIDKPKFCLFIDEAHLVFANATKSLQDQLEQIIKLIRSKGVGIYFITQNPTDIPAAILSQLGLKIQHALRAFTANDNKAIKLAAANYPLSDYYNAAEVLTQLGIGEAFVSALDEKGRPTPLVRAMLSSPQSRMDVLTSEEISAITSASNLIPKYNTEVDSESAYELLSKKIEASQQAAQAAEATREEIKEIQTKTKEDPSFIESLGKNKLFREVGRTMTREVARGIFGILKGK